MLCRSPDWGMRGGMQRDRALALYIHKKRLLRSFLTHRNLENLIVAKNVANSRCLVDMFIPATAGARASIVAL